MKQALWSNVFQICRSDMCGVDVPERMHAPGNGSDPGPLSPDGHDKDGELQSCHT